jgi:hypothetical protein
MENNKLKKEFKHNGIILTREDYESIPCAMCAMEFTDEQMQILVERVANILSAQYGYTEHEISLLEKDTENMECYEEIFWREMEGTALNMGMRYYEDFTDEEFEKVKKL